MNNATFIASYYIYLLFIMPIVIDGQVRIEITFFLSLIGWIQITLIKLIMN